MKKNTEIEIKYMIAIRLWSFVSNHEASPWPLFK